MIKRLIHNKLCIKNSALCILAMLRYASVPLGRAVTFALCITLCGCSLSRPYVSTSDVPDNIMGDVTVAGDTVSLGAIGWREMFTDTLLQQLIIRALENNTDLRSAQHTIEQAQNDLSVAQKGWYPTLSFEPTGALRHFNHATTYPYLIPLTASWQAGIFGQVTTKKRLAKAQREYYVDYKKAVQTDLSAQVACTYYMLVMLDRKLQILKETQTVWEQSLESMRTLYEAGLYQSPAVHQMEASLESVRIGILELQEDIITTESALCLLLSEPPHHIQRSPYGTFHVPKQLHVGIPLRLLSARPDVRQAERAMEIAFYNTQQARQNFYPDITITGTLGWGNDDGLVNPSKLLAGAVASIVQPLFMQGKLRAQYKNRQIDQEKASLQFTQTLLNAGNEIYTHLHTCIKSEEQIKHYAIMINALQQAYDATLELMNNGTNTYLEVLKAQEDLLSGQLSEVENTNDEIQAFINLYTALGGF